MRKAEVGQALLVLRTEVNAIRNSHSPGTGLLDDSTPPPKSRTKAQLVNEANDLIDEILAAGRPAPYRKVRVPGATPHDDIEVVGATPATPAPATPATPAPATPAPATPATPAPATPAPATPAPATPAPATPATPAPAPPPAPPASAQRSNQGVWVALVGLLVLAATIVLHPVVERWVTPAPAQPPTPVEETTAAPAQPTPAPVEGESFPTNQLEEAIRRIDALVAADPPRHGVAVRNAENGFSAREISYAGSGGFTLEVKPKEAFQQAENSRLNRRVRMLELESARQERMHQHIDTE